MVIFTTVRAILTIKAIPIVILFLILILILILVGCIAVLKIITLQKDFSNLKIHFQELEFF